MVDKNNNSLLELDKHHTEVIQQVFELELSGHKDARELYQGEIAGFFIRTDDGSFTIKSDERNEESETLHSKFGAKTEAYEKFVKPSKLKEKIGAISTIKILDICSGIGYNAAALLDYLSDVDCNIEIDMVESSIETLATILFIPKFNESYCYIKKAVELYLIENGYLQFNKVLSNIPSNIKINIHVKDARNFLKFNATDEYDAVFLDPYSPIKSPELYTVDFFNKLKQFLTPNALVLTYTAASPVRNAIVEADLHIGEGPEFHRSGGTIASRNSEMIDVPLSFDDEKVIALSDVGVVYIDPDLNDDYDTIVERRLKMRQNIRSKTVFPSSNKLPRYLGRNPDAIEESLLNKLNAYVQEMGFSSINDPEIMEILDIDKSLPSRDQIKQLKLNLQRVLESKEGR